MADVRSMLRQERASRQQATRPQKQSATPASAPTSKKRKAADDGGEERKRTRTEMTAGVPAGFFDGGAGDQEAADELSEETAPQEDIAQPTEINMTLQVTKPTNPPQAPSNAEDLEDLDAFLKDMEEEPKRPNTLPAYTGAVVEAAPMTAAEIAAQAREEMSAQRGKKDEELAAEKEDAARALEEEFEEMEGLEERVKKLREKREALRSQAKSEDIVLADPEPIVEDDPMSASEDEDDDWDDWRFRPA